MEEDCNNPSYFDHSFSVPFMFKSPESSVFQMNGLASCPVPMFTENSLEDKGASSSSRSHSEAEKRRRDRINAQLATLRKLIPKSDKMDKAALLGSVIDQVKELKQKAQEISKTITVPTETDQVTVDSDTIDDNFTLIRASLCCEDRPELFKELIRVLKGLKLSIVNADVVSVGGRVKSSLVLCNNNKDIIVSLGTIKQSLNAVLTRIAAAASLPSNFRVRSKRQRFFLPSTS